METEKTEARLFLESMWSEVVDNQLCPSLAEHISNSLIRTEALNKAIFVEYDVFRYSTTPKSPWMRVKLVFDQSYDFVVLDAFFKNEGSGTTCVLKLWSRYKEVQIDSIGSFPTSDFGKFSTRLLRKAKKGKKS